MTKVKPAKIGECLLSKTRGKLVRSHLIPRAFTKPTEPGAPLLQAGMGTRVTKRFDSWYDAGIVTRIGEDVLARIDDAAVTELRRLRLVWSGWGTDRDLGTAHIPIAGTPYGLRRLRDHNAHVIRMFCLSLLWRAAVSTRFEFGGITLPETDVERLRELIMTDDPGPLDFYPVELVQLSTLGLIHNQTPIFQTKHIPGVPEQPGHDVDIVRFYLDGLIVHMRRHASDDGKTAAAGPLIVGGEAELAVTTVTYEQSLQAWALADTIAHATYPDPSKPVGGKRRGS